MIKYVLTDIEGTTTPVHFVHDVLFPYAKQRMAGYIRSNIDKAEVTRCLQNVQQTVKEESGEDIEEKEAIETLLHWIDTDRKHTALKELQGYIWKEGYENGNFQGQVYDDVKPVLEKWKAQEIRLGVYSSGSIEAQKLLFGHSDKGDLTPLFSDYFDTKTGPKKEAASYHKISEQLGIKPGNILFLSDVEAELDAAAAAGFQVIQLARENDGTQPSAKHKSVTDFSQVNLKVYEREYLQ